MIWSMPVTYKSSPVGEPTGLRAATNMFLEFNLGSRSVALLVYLRMWEQMLSPLRDRMRERIAWQE